MRIIFVSSEEKPSANHLPFNHLQKQGFRAGLLIMNLKWKQVHVIWLSFQKATNQATNQPTL